MATYSSKPGFRYIPGAEFDFESATCVNTETKAATKFAATTVVDARFTEPDLPVFVKPTFKYDAAQTEVITANDLSARTDGADGQHFCVIGAGKTGQDAVLFLQNQLSVQPERIAWVMPNDPWITARAPPMDTCMEFLSTCAAAADGAAADTAEFVQRGYLALEKQGKVYRIDESRMPTKFMNATLNESEVETLRKVKNIVRHGRVSEIVGSSDLRFADGTVVPLPWGSEHATTFVHCSAGAFNFSGSAEESHKPVFAPGLITVQEIFNYPGFCFNGMLIAKVESEVALSMDEKNALCELPPPATASAQELGPSGGDIGPLHDSHGLVISIRNLRRWYDYGFGEWLHGNRLFSLAMNGFSLQDGKALMERNCTALKAAGMLKD
jgi:hypothetical protein